MASTSTTPALSSWRLESAVEPFFSGGAVAALPDGRLLAACGDEVKIVNVGTGAVECALAGDSEPVTAIAAGPCGTRVYAASRSLSLRAWRLTTTTSTVAVVGDDDDDDDGDSDGDGDEGERSSRKARRPSTATVSTTTAECLRSWRAHRSPVVAMAVDSSGGLLATAGADRCARVFDADAFHCTHAFSTSEGGVVTAVAFHPDPRALVLFTAGDDGTVRGWDLRGRSCLAVLRGHGSAVTALVPAPPAPATSGAAPAGEGAGASSKRKKTREGDGGGGDAAAAAPNPAALRLISAGRDGVVVVWDWLSRSKVAEIAAMEAVEGAALVSAAGSTAAAAAGELTIATAGAKGCLRLWSSSTRREVARLDAPGGGEGSGGSGRELTALVGVPSSTRAGGFAACDRLLAATADGRVVAFDGASSRELRTSAHLIGDLDEITDVRFLGGSRATRKGGASQGPKEDGNGGWRQPTHAAVATSSADIRVMRLPTPSSSSPAGCSASLVGHSAAVLALDSACVPDPSSPGPPEWLLASGGKDATILVWRPLSPDGGGASPSPSAVVRPSACAPAAHAGAVTALSWSRRRPGAFLVSGGEDRLLKVWELEGPSLALRPPDGEGKPRPTPPLSASAATVAHEKAINALDVSPDDALVATASQDRTAKVWKLPHLLPLATLRGHRRGVWDCRFSPAARLVATASGDATVRLWSLPDGACLRSLEGHGASVLRCAFFGGGAGLASVGADGLLKAWTVRTGECASTSDAHDAKAWALDASDDGTLGNAGSSERVPGVLATGGADGRLLIWRDASSAVARAAREAAAADAAGAQALANALALGDVRGAAELALTLGAPARLLTAVQAAAALEDGAKRRDGSGLAALRSAVRASHDAFALESTSPSPSPSPRKDGLRVALEAVRSWNARAATCHEAHLLLSAVLSEFSPSELVGGGTSNGRRDGRNSGYADLLDGILAYTTRHARRADRLLEATYVVEAALAEAGVLSDDDGDDGGEGEASDDASDDAGASAPRAPSGAAARRAAAIARLNGEVVEGEAEEEGSEGEDDDSAVAAAAAVEDESEEESSESEERAASPADVAPRRSTRAAEKQRQRDDEPAKKETTAAKKRSGGAAAAASSKNKRTKGAPAAVATPSRALRKR